MESHATANGVRFTEDDVVNIDDWNPGDDGLNAYKPWLFHDHGFVLGLVFAQTLQDAFDELADSGKIDSFAVSEAEMGDYPDEQGLSHLGNECKPYDVECVCCVAMGNPPLSFVACAQMTEILT